MEIEKRDLNRGRLEGVSRRAMGKLLGIAVGLWLLSGVFFTLETLRPARTQPRWRRDSKTDVAYFFFTGVVTRPVGTLAAVVALVLSALVAGYQMRPGAVQAYIQERTLMRELPVLVQLVVGLFLADFIGYWTHRGFHRFRTLWRFHAVHHSSEDLDWLSSARVHPVNAAISRFLLVLLLIPFGFDVKVLGTVGPLLTLYGLFLHANVRVPFGPLRYLVASPAFHRWHHSADERGMGKNFAGLFPVLDLVFGTFHLPSEGPERFGVAGERLPDGLLRQMWYPFRARRLRGAAE